jgi:hypothetical protein
MRVTGVDVELLLEAMIVVDKIRSGRKAKMESHIFDFVDGLE